VNPDLWVLACAPGSRTDEANDLFNSLGTPLDRRVLVTTFPDPVTNFEGALLLYPDVDINISKWWNLGLEWIAEQYDTNPDARWDVVVAETDARMKPEDVDTLRTLMRSTGAVMAGGDWENTLSEDTPQYYRTDNLSAPVGRIPGIMKVVAGETGIRHDTALRWWLADDDYEWEHRISGGTLLVRGIGVEHTGTQGPLTGERLQAWKEDQVRFFDKWGGMPGTNGILQ
jgi:hypothetical protein